MTLDRYDRMILGALQSDGRISNKQLAGRVNLSESACLRRVRSLEGSGMIDRYVALLSQAKVGLSGSVFVQIGLHREEESELAAFEEAVKNVPEVMECYSMAGIWDYMLKIVTRNISHYENFVRNTLTTSPAIRELHSHMAVTEIKNSTELPLETQL